MEPLQTHRSLSQHGGISNMGNMLWSCWLPLNPPNWYRAKTTAKLPPHTPDVRSAPCQPGAWRRRGSRLVGSGAGRYCEFVCTSERPRILLVPSAGNKNLNDPYKPSPMPMVSFKGTPGFIPSFRTEHQYAIRINIWSTI